GDGWFPNRTLCRTRERAAGVSPAASCVILPATRYSSCVACTSFVPRIGTMNPPLTPPRRGTDKTPTNSCSPPGRGRGWVGSWKASRYPPALDVLPLVALQERTEGTPA